MTKDSKVEYNAVDNELKIINKNYFSNEISIKKSGSYYMCSQN